MTKQKIRSGIIAFWLAVVMAVTFCMPALAEPADPVISQEDQLSYEMILETEATEEEQDITADVEEILDEDTDAEIVLQEEPKAEDAGPVVEELDADTYLNYANGIKAGVYGWNLSENGKYYMLGSVGEDGKQIVEESAGFRPGMVNRTYIGVYNETQITNKENQCMMVYVPAAYLNEDGSVNYDAEINGYTAKTAPIVFEGNNGGWRSGTAKECKEQYIDEGFIYVSCGSRSRDAKDSSNKYWTGKAPAMVVDLKAGVIQLRANDDVIPGDKDRIISVGTSGAGQMSSILGASGDMEEYYPFLSAYGANGMTENDGTYASAYSDSVYAAQCYCPIADLENADLAYAWMRYGAGDTGATAMGASEPAVFTDFDYALQEAEAEAFVDYINSLELVDEDGNKLELTGIREGSYYDKILKNISDSLNAYAADAEFPIQVKDRQGNVTGEYKDLDTMISERYKDTDKWLEKGADGTYKVTDLAGFINGTGLVRNKLIPGFDQMDGMAENDAFGNDIEFSVHYSDAVGQILKDNYEDFSKLEGFNKEYVDKFIEDTVGTGAEASNDDAIDFQTNLMNATEILLGNNGLEAVTPAQYFRTRNGTADEHTSFTIAYNLCLAAKAFGSDIDYSLVWDMGHGDEEGTSTGTFIDWIKEIAPPAGLKGISLDKTSAELATEKTLQLNVIFDPENAINKNVIWTSSDENIASVDEKGVVTAHTFGKATITATAEDGGYTATCDIQTRYYDVLGSADRNADDYIYWFAPVYWAAEKGITKGYGNVYFGPEQNCTREQMITFLYRQANSPKPKTTKMPFSDVKKGSYYYNAVLWAYENGITKGYSTGKYKGKFGVGLNVTREDTVTFIYRMAAGKPSAGGGKKFSDVKSSDYYAKAIAWASANKITNGYSDGPYKGKFGVGLPVLRKDIVTFLYRYDAIK